MKKLFAVRGLTNFALLALFGGLVGGCSLFKPHSEIPLVVVNVKDQTLVLRDGRLLTKCTPPAPGSTVAAPGECRGLRGVKVLEVKPITVLKTQHSPDCYVYVWEYTYYEVCD